MDRRLGSGAPQDRQPPLHARQSARRHTRGKFRSPPAGDRDPAQGDEGRVISLRTELLPQVPAGGAHGAAGRYLDLSSGVSLHLASQAITIGDFGTETWNGL